MEFLRWIIVLALLMPLGSRTAAIDQDHWPDWSIRVFGDGHKVLYTELDIIGADGVFAQNGNDVEIGHNRMTRINQLGNSANALIEENDDGDGRASLDGETLYVRPNGGDYGSENGSDWNNAFDGFADIAWGDQVGQVGAGDTLYVAGGLYTETLVIDASGTLGSPILIKRATAEAHGTDIGWSSGLDVLVDIQQGKICIRDKEYITLDGAFEYGIRLSNTELGAPFTYHGRMIEVNGRHIVVQNIELIGPGMNSQYPLGAIGCIASYPNNHHITLRNLGIHEFTTGGVKFDHVDHLTVEHSEIYNVSSIYSQIHSNHLAIFYHNTNVVVRNNFIGNPGYGSLAGMGLMFAETTIDAEVYNNVFYELYCPFSWDFNGQTPLEGYMRIYNNAFVGYRVAISASGATGVPGDYKYADVYNNIFSNQGFDPTECRAVFLDVDDYTHDYNLFYSDTYSSGAHPNWPYAYGESHGVVTEDIKFVDVGNLDFHLLEDSPAVDQGTDLGAPYNVDKDGVSRPQGAGWDIGAYEFAPDLDLRGAPGDQTIYLDWTVNTTLPPTTTWHIDYYTTTASAPFTTTDPFSITRAYALTDHVVNYQWYTVTLHAMVGSTSWVSDTVRVMPTDICVHLPLVLRDE